MASGTMQVQSARFQREETLLLGVLFATNAVVVTGTQMLPALFPALARAFDTPLTTVVLLSSVLSFTSLLAPLFGPWADRYGHWAFLLGGLLLFGGASLVSAAAPLFAFLLVFQAVVGLSRAILSFVITSYVGDTFAYEVRGRAMGIVRSAVSVALIIGVPAVAMLADQFSVRSAFFAVGILALATCGLNAIVAPKRHAQVQAAAPRDAGAWRSYVAILGQKEVAVSLIALFLWSMVPTGVFLYLAAWLQGTFSFTNAQVGWAFSLIGIGSLAGNALAAVATDRLGKRRIAMAGLVAMGAFAALLPWSSVIWQGLAALLLFTMALDFSSSAFFTLLTEMNREYRATLMSMTTLVIGVATGLTPLIVSPLLQLGGYSLVTTLLGATAVTIAIIVGLFVTEQKAPPSG